MELQCTGCKGTQDQKERSYCGTYLYSQNTELGLVTKVPKHALWLRDGIALH